MPPEPLIVGALASGLQPTSSMPVDATSVQVNEVRAYYRRVLPFYDLELADRGDGDLWTWAASAPAGCRVLELGAGTGRATACFARAAGFVVALDLSPEMIAIARGRLAGAAKVALVV